MTKFCNQCGKQLLEGELCNCKLAAERRLKSIPNSKPVQIENSISTLNPVQVDSDNDNMEAIPIQQDMDMIEMIEAFPPIISGVPEDFKRGMEEELEKWKEMNDANTYSYYKVNNNQETTDENEQTEVVNEKTSNESFDINVQGTEAMNEIVWAGQPDDEQIADIKSDVGSKDSFSAEASSSEMVLQPDPDTYKDLVQKADPINVHNSDTKVESRSSAPVFSKYIKIFFYFMVGCFKEPGSYLFDFVKKGTKGKSIFFIIIEAILHSAIVVFLLNGVSDIISNSHEDLLLLAGYSENFPLIRSFILTIILVFVDHIVFSIVLLLLQKKTDDIKLNNAMCVSAVRSIACIPFLVVGIIAAIIYPLAGLAFIGIGNLLSIFFVNGALKEAWERDTNKMIYTVFLVFFITMLISIIVFAFFFHLYLPERTVTRWVN